MESSGHNRTDLQRLVARGRCAQWAAMKRPLWPFCTLTWASVAQNVSLLMPVRFDVACVGTLLEPEPQKCFCWSCHDTLGQLAGVQCGEAKHAPCGLSSRHTVQYPAPSARVMWQHGVG